MTAQRPRGRALHAVTSAQYSVQSKVWLYPGKGGWHFATLSPRHSAEISARFSMDAKSWGSLPARIRIGATEWSTSIFPDAKSGCYRFAIKAEVRHKEAIAAGDTITAAVRIGH